MSKPTIESLKCKRANIKRQATHFEKVLKAIDDDTDLDTLDLENRLKRHSESWEEFDKYQSQIEEYLSEEEQSPSHEATRTEFEERFYELSALARNYLRKMSSASLTALTNSASQSSPTTIPEQNDDSNSHSGSIPLNVHAGSSPHRFQVGYIPLNVDLGSIPTTSNANQSQFSRHAIPENVETVRLTRENSVNRNFMQLSSHFQLPRLPTPIFHGTFDTWLAFHDSFKSMCHDNPDIPPINKFLYLKACVQGEAAEVIASLETSDSNYSIAWELLKNRYDNRKFIVESHVKAFHEIPTISKEFPVRALLDNIQKRLRALKALGESVNHWDTLLIFSIKEKLNSYTREKWEESVGSAQVPSMKDMISFLERRSFIESTQPFPKQSHPQRFLQKNGKDLRINLKTPQTCMSTAAISKIDNFKLKCFMCSEEHMLYSCNQFLDLSEQARYEFVKKASICHNCFSGTHRTIECRKSPCRKCKKRHNVLLHFN